jgi:hypothetical protein
LPEPKARSVAASAVRSNQDSRRSRLEFVDADLFGLSSTRLHLRATMCCGLRSNATGTMSDYGTDKQQNR